MAPSSSKSCGPEGFQVGHWPRWGRVPRLIARVLRDDKRLFPLTIGWTPLKVFVLPNLESTWSSSPLSTQSAKGHRMNVGWEGSGQSPREVRDVVVPQEPSLGWGTRTESGLG